MKKLFISALVYFVMLVSAEAQQRPQYTQYVLNNYLTNPAVGGIESYADLRLGYRTQWAGLEGAPKSFYATMHGSIGNSNNSVGSGSNRPKETKSRYGFSKKSSYKKSRPHHGIGAIAQVDEAGLLKTSTLNASYSYHQPLNRYMTLASGISSGITQFKVNTQEAVIFDPSDPYLNSSFENATKIDLTVGFWLYSSDFYLGVSGAQLLRNGNDFESAGTDRNPHMRQQAHFYATAGLRLQPSNYIALVPSVMVKATESAKPAIDFNARLMYAQRIWAGASYRHQDAMAVMAGVNINHIFDVGYSYDKSTSAISKVSAGSHEVVLGIKLNNHRKIICPTWMW
ncbi:PorP/SprF family type IX secretion system membrane protein [Pontibacter sp. H249]|uniref:PorP/SprF family type IX secretion system membrane protein n=1 Tax=Pontibacter sp. H249 TaxID=3133420 RepID=UPI0030C1334E